MLIRVIEVPGVSPATMLVNPTIFYRVPDVEVVETAEGMRVTVTAWTPGIVAEAALTDCIAAGEG